MPQFLLLLTENDNAWRRLQPDERKSLMEKYFAWVKRLKEENRLRGGEPLASGGSVLKVVGGKTVESPFAETRDVLTGYFQIEAADLAEATRVAHGCPALIHGETVIVRPIADMTSDHMGA
jgi:hypothetical protein